MKKRNLKEVRNNERVKLEREDSASNHKCVNEPTAISGTFGTDFQITRFVSAEVLEAVILPRDNKGNVLRGAFGSIFKQICCGLACSK